MITETHLRWLSLTTLVTLAILVGRFGTKSELQGQPKAAVKPKDPIAPRAMVLVQTKYPQGQLDDTHRNEAVELAFELAHAGFQVDLVTEADSAEAVKTHKQALMTKAKNLPKQFELHLTVANDSEEVEKVIHDWIDVLDKEKTPLAILVMSGHGVERKKEPTFLTIKDTEEAGGLPMASILSKVGQSSRGIPLAIVWNTCRLEKGIKDMREFGPLKVKDKEGNPIVVPKDSEPTPVTSGSDTWLTNRRSTFGFRSGELYNPKERFKPTVLYTTRMGEAAKAGNKDNLTVVGYLAEALRNKDRFDAFLRVMYPSRLNQPTLRFLEWVHYGVANFQRTALSQSHELLIGDIVTLETVIAARTAAGLQANRIRQDAFNLLHELLIKDAGELDFEHKFAPTPGSLAVTFRGKQLAAPWAGAKVGSDNGIDPSDKVLELEYVAERGAQTPLSSQSLKFVFNPTHRLPGGEYANLAINQFSRSGVNSASSPVFTAFFNQPSRVVLPLFQMKDPTTNVTLSLEAIGIAPATVTATDVWPTDATIRILRMNVLPSDQVPRAIIGFIPQPVNLEIFPEVWRFGDQFPKEPSLKLDPSGNSFKLAPDANSKTYSRAGGQLLPNKYIPKGSMLRLELGNSSNAEAELVIDLLHEDEIRNPTEKFLNRETIKIPANSSVIRRDIPIMSFGWVNYLSLSTKSSGIELRRISLVKDPKVK